MSRRVAGVPPARRGGHGRRPGPDLASALDLLGRVLAPPAVVTSLAVWFGWSVTSARASWFGVDTGVLGLTTFDYVLRSVDALVVLLAVLLTATAAGLAVHAIAAPAVLRWRRRRLAVQLSTGAALVGSTLWALGLTAVLRPVPGVSGNYLGAPTTLALGVLVTAYGGRLALRLADLDAGLRGHLGRAVTGVCGALVLVAVFWGSSSYAAAVGRGRAVTLAGDLERRPHVTVVSRRALGLEDVGAGVAVARENAPPAFRYTGLRLLARTDTRYVLLPRGWTRTNGRAVVLDEDPTLRFEFSPGGP